MNIGCMVLRSGGPNQYKLYCLGSQAIGTNYVTFILLASD
jgi:hypothetical protein